MNVFILTTGRAGSVSFIAACQHIKNFTASHESRSNRIGHDHFAYPLHHIEADNRLSWFLGSLDKWYGDNAMYVHLIRDRRATCESFLNRYESGIIKAYREDMLLGDTTRLDPLQICMDYYDTVNDNIVHFLKDKSNTMVIHLEEIQREYALFWERIGATGDLNASLAEWNIPKNESRKPTGSRRLVRKIVKTMRRLTGA
jgi:hypothetical protein